MARLASRRIRQLVLNVLIVVDGVHGGVGRNGQVRRNREGAATSGARRVVSPRSVGGFLLRLADDGD